MAITRFDPFREFMTVQERMNRLFGQAYLRDEELSRAAWVPPVDIYETEQHDLVIKAELPDMAREDIEVTVEHNTLTLKGTKLGCTTVGSLTHWIGDKINQEKGWGPSGITVVPIGGMPPARAASVREAPSKTSAKARRRRAWPTSRARRASDRRSHAKSSSRVTSREIGRAHV